jgi:alkylated DNA repair protein alkB family protein 6
MFGETKDTPLVGPLQDISFLLVKQGIFLSCEPPNHCLLNEYQPGQGILPHTDGSSYASRTATISLTSSVVFEFTKRLSSDAIGKSKDSEDSGRIQVLLEPGSLIVFEEDA